MGVSFVANPINYLQIYEAASLVKDLGVANFRLSVAYTPEGINLFKDEWDEINRLSREAKKLEGNGFKVFDFATSHLETLDYQRKGYDFCGYQHFTTVIGADQKAYPCCTLKYNASICFGSLEHHSFKEIWMGKDREDWLKKDHLKLVCNKNPCWMDRKNKFISYLIKKDVPHVNYI